tara:strand:- start:2 stop:373 length:372 start_codon:yes stop_codon:yes gene_type:complete
MYIYNNPKPTLAPTREVSQLKENKKMINIKEIDSVTLKAGDRIEYNFLGDEDNEPSPDVMTVKALKDLDPEDFFKFKPTTTNKAVWFRSSKFVVSNKITATNWTTGKETFKDKETLVFVGFIF